MDVPTAEEAGCQLIGLYETRNFSFLLGRAFTGSPFFVAGYCDDAEGMSMACRAMMDWKIAAFALITLFAAPAATIRAQATADVDTALILAVDVSDSVDAERYRLQMEGIAQALEDPGVIASITGGAQGRILLTLVTWADRSELAMPWQVIGSEADSRRVAALVRDLPQRTGEFTCVSRMLEWVRERIITETPLRPARVVLDVSGDGIDNCRDPNETLRARDSLVTLGLQINGLPIIVKGENEVVGAGAYRAPGFGLGQSSMGPGTHQTTLDAWYLEHVVGGPAGFLVRADGFEDFGRAFKQKFVSEISAR